MPAASHHPFQLPALPRARNITAARTRWLPNTFSAKILHGSQGGAGDPSLACAGYSGGRILQGCLGATGVTQ